MSPLSNKSNFSDMTSAKEKGILNFMGEFARLNTTINGFGATYNPPEKLRLSNLQDAYIRATTILSELNLAFSANKNAISVRTAQYATLQSRITRVVNFFAITNADSSLKVNVKATAAKLHSASRKAKDSNVMQAEGNGLSTEEPKTHSTAQTGFENKLGHLRLITAMVETEATYTPAESDISVASLKAFASDLEHNNLLVMETQSRLTSLRKQRDEFLFGKTNSLRTLGQEVKKYVVAVYGANSNEAKAIKSIRLS